MATKKPAKAKAKKATPKVRDLSARKDPKGGAQKKETSSKSLRIV